MKCVDCSRPGVGKCDVHLLEWWATGNPEAMAMDVCSFLRESDQIHWWSWADVVNPSQGKRWRLQQVLNKDCQSHDGNTKMLRNVSKFVQDFAHRVYPGVRARYLRMLRFDTMFPAHPRYK